MCKYLLRPPFALGGVHSLSEGRDRLDLLSQGRLGALMPGHCLEGGKRGLAEMEEVISNLLAAQFVSTVQDLSKKPKPESAEQEHHQTRSDTTAVGGSTLFGRVRKGWFSA